MFPINLNPVLLPADKLTELLIPQLLITDKSRLVTQLGTWNVQEEFVISKEGGLHVLSHLINTGFNFQRDTEFIFNILLDLFGQRHHIGTGTITVVDQYN